MSKEFTIITIPETSIEVMDEAKADAVHNALEAGQTVIVVGENAEVFCKNYDLGSSVQTFQGEEAVSFSHAYKDVIFPNGEVKVNIALTPGEFPVLRLLVEKIFVAPENVEYVPIPTGIRGVFYAEIIEDQRFDRFNS
jgi:hypothetical protein